MMARNNKKIGKNKKNVKNVASIISPKRTRSISKKLKIEILTPRALDISEKRNKNKTVSEVVNRPKKSNNIEKNYVSPRRMRSNTKKNVSLNIFKPNVLIEVPHGMKKSIVKSSTCTVHVKSKNFTVNSIVLAKQKYSIPWPARVLKINSDSVYVYFFGDTREGFVDPSEIYDFANSTDSIRSVIRSNRKPRYYIDGILEAEQLLGIPKHISILNRN